MTEKLITDIAPVVVDKMDKDKLFSKKGAAVIGTGLLLLLGVDYVLMLIRTSGEKDVKRLEHENRMTEKRLDHENRMTEQEADHKNRMDEIQAKKGTEPNTEKKFRIMMPDVTWKNIRLPNGKTLTMPCTNMKEDIRKCCSATS